MRPNLLTIAAALAVALPGVAQEQPETLLSPNEIKSLNKKLREWIGYELAYLRASERGKRNAKKKRDRARDSFSKDWEKKTDKHELLASMPDLEAVFRNAFPYDRFKGLTGQLTAMGGKGGGPKYDVWVPKGYDPEVAYRSVIVLPGRHQERPDEWADGRDYFDAAWKDSALLDDTIYVIPRLDPDLDLETIPDFSRPEETDNDRRRREALFATAGEAQRELNFDRSRLILDCGKGTSRFGLRMATYYPTRFAGLILRHPEDLDLRYQSLCGMPLLLIANEETKGFCEQLHGQLEELSPGSCTVLEAKGSYPYGELQPEVSAWARDARRDLFRDKVVIAPNHDLYHRAYWIQIGTAEPLGTVPPEERPYLEATVDREANKITVEAKSITDFVMYLNDAIVDFDKEVTVVVNGVAHKQKRSREFSFLRETVDTYFDPTMLFTVKWPMAVPETN